MTIEDDLAEYRPRGTFKSIEIGDDLPRKGNEEDEGDLDLPRRPKNTEDDLELPRKPKQEISEDLAPRRTLGPVKQEPDLDLPRGEGTVLLVHFIQTLFLKMQSERELMIWNYPESQERQMMELR